MQMSVHVHFLQESQVATGCGLAFPTENSRWMHLDRSCACLYGKSQDATGCDLAFPVENNWQTQVDRSCKMHGKAKTQPVATWLFLAKTTACTCLYRKSQDATGCDLAFPIETNRQMKLGRSCTCLCRKSQDPTGLGLFEVLDSFLWHQFHLQTKSL